MTRAATLLAQARALPLAPLDAITRGRALILAPHPDDESLGCGGLIAEACAQGQPPFLVMFTDGAGSHPNSALYPPARLRATREAETLAAATCLGLPSGNIVFLRYPDTQAPTEGSALIEAANRLTTLLHNAGCNALLTSWEHDPHCDHLAAHRVATLAARQAGVPHRAFPVWGLTLPDDTHLDAAPPAGARLDVTRHLPAKRRAIGCHASQYAGLISDDPGGFQMAPAFMALFDAPTEIYLDVP